MRELKPYLLLLLSIVVFSPYSCFGQVDLKLNAPADLLIASSSSQVFAGILRDEKPSSPTIDWTKENEISWPKRLVRNDTSRTFLGTENSTERQNFHRLASGIYNTNTSILMENSDGHVTVEIDGDHAGSGVGRVTSDQLSLTGGADLAEYFDVSGASIEEGSVVSIDAYHPGKLAISKENYDTKVVGVVSGAGQIKPGIIMGQDGTIASGEYSISIIGRVFVKTSLENGAIQPGDFLTSSSEAGIAMKATDRSKMHGSIIGKAMTGINEDGLVLIFLNIQ